MSIGDVRKPARGLLDGLVGPCSIWQFRSLRTLIIRSPEVD